MHIRLWEKHKADKDLTACTTGRPGGIQSQVGQEYRPGPDSDSHCQTACDDRADCKYWMRFGGNCYTYRDGIVDVTSSWALGHRFGVKSGGRPGAIQSQVGKEYR